MFSIISRSLDAWYKHDKLAEFAERNRTVVFELASSGHLGAHELNSFLLVFAAWGTSINFTF